MSDTIKQYVEFHGIPLGDTATLPHHLVLNGHPVAPDAVWLQFLQDFEWVASSTTTITLRNVASVTGDCRVLVEAWHPVERMFGLSPDDGTFSRHLIPQPFVFALIPAPPPVPTPFQLFLHTVGDVPDKSEITVTIPVAMLDTNYGVIVRCQGVAAIAEFDVTTKTLTTFVVSCTGDLQIGDVLLCWVAPLTA